MEGFPLYNEIPLSINSTKQGFTLIEFLIASSIFAIGIMALTTMQLRALRATDTAAQITEATVMAESMMEKLISLRWSDPKLEDIDKGSYNIDSDKGLNHTGIEADHRNLSNSVYSLFWNIADSHILQDSKTIKVIVTWKDKGGFEKRVSLERVIVKGI